MGAQFRQLVQEALRRRVRPRAESIAEHRPPAIGVAMRRGEAIGVGTNRFDFHGDTGVEVPLPVPTLCLLHRRRGGAAESTRADF